jgi:hypothetical protein
MRAAIRLTVLVAFVTTCVVPDALAWGDDGHQIVARIAARKLTSNTRRQIVTILRGAMPDDLGLTAIVGSTGAPQPPSAKLKEALSKMAIWPNTCRVEREPRVRGTLSTLACLKGR